MSEPHEYASVRLASSLGRTPMVIELDGELDYCTVPMIEDALAAACQSAMDLVLDLGGLRFCDCAGLSVLLRTARRCEAEGGRLRLAAAQLVVARLLTLARTPEVIPVYPRVADAVAAARSGRPADNIAAGRICAGS